MGVSRKTRGSNLVELRRCRCGATPALAETEIDNGVTAHAVHCSKMCGDDSHWQMSMTEAIKRWNTGKVRGASGGNGVATDDLQNQNRQ
jgi:hypothetical protein